MWGIDKKDPHLAPLTYAVGRIVNDFSVGLRQSAMKGRGPEFVGYREYDPADSARDIAWPASARLPEDDDVLSYEREPERQVRVLLIADERISMHSPLMKPRYARALVRLFGLSAFENSDPFGVVGVGGEGVIFSGWLSSEGRLDDFLKSASDKRLRRAFRAPSNRLSSLFFELKPQNTIIIFLTDLSEPGAAPIEELRGIDAVRMNATIITVILDEWWGFSPAPHLITMEHPETGKQVVSDMRGGGDLSREVGRFERRVAELKLRGRSLLMKTLRVPLAHEKPLRAFNREWLRNFEE